MGELGGTVKSLFYFHLRSGLIFLFVTVLAIGGVIYHFSEQVLIHTVESNLRAHAEFRKGRIDAFVNAEKHWVATVTANDEIVEHVETLMALYREQAPDSEPYSALIKQLQKEYSVLTQSGGADELFLLTPTGELAFSMRSAQEDVGAELTGDGMYGDTIFSELIEQIMERPILSVSNYGYLEMLDRQTVLMGAPIFSISEHGEKRFIGILVRPLGLGWLREMLSHYSGLGVSGDVVIAQKERTVEDVIQVNFINLLRSSDERTLQCATQQRLQPERFPMLQLASAAEGFGGSLAGSGWVMDAKCKEVFAVWNWIPELQWGMVVKQDREEVLVPIDVLQKEIAGALLFSVIFLVWLAQRQARSMSQPIEQLTDAANKDRIDEYPIGKVAEINQLASAIRRLVDTLHKNEVELEEKVELRTQELSSEKDFVEMILNSMQEGMLVLNRGGEVIRANQMMVQLAGRRPPFVLQKLFDAEREESGVIRGVLNSSSGEQIPVQVSEIELDHQQIGGRLEQGSKLMLFYDLRERIRMEEQEQYLAFQSGVAEMSATLLHNIGNAITGINGDINRLEDKSGQLVKLEESLHALSQQCKEERISLEKCSQGFELVSKVLNGEGLREVTEEMKAGVNRISGIVRSHRTLGVQEVRATHFDLKAMVEDAIDLIRDDFAEADVVLELECQDYIQLNLPRNPMIQMVLNLVRNSLESIQERRSIEPDYVGKVTISCEDIGAEDLYLKISDDGMGIEPDRHKEVFSHQYSSKPNGSGFGLHAVANFVNSIEGKVSVESGGYLQGAALVIVLPRNL